MFHGYFLNVNLCLRNKYIDRPLSWKRLIRVTPEGQAACANVKNLMDSAGVYQKDIV